MPSVSSNVKKKKARNQGETFTSLLGDLFQLELTGGVD